MLLEEHLRADDTMISVLGPLYISPSLEESSISQSYTGIALGELQRRVKGRRCSSAVENKLTA